MGGSKDPEAEVPSVRDAVSAEIAITELEDELPCDPVVWLTPPGFNHALCTMNLGCGYQWEKAWNE